MNLAEKSQAVLDLFVELDSEAKQFAAEANLSCLSGCGFCCANPQIAASAQEFLPLAFDLYEKGLAESTLVGIETATEAGKCVVYRPQSDDGSKGFCGNYSKRGMICRLFAASARRDRLGKKALIICKILKEERPDDIQNVTARINDDMEIPLATGYYTRLKDIDESLCHQHPINRAISLALEAVLRYKFYEDQDQTPQA
jgi:Fe-S-cluster containining protein